MHSGKRGQPSSPPPTIWASSGNIKHLSWKLVQKVFQTRNVTATYEYDGFPRFILQRCKKNSSRRWLARSINGRRRLYLPHKYLVLFSFVLCSMVVFSPPREGIYCYSVPLATSARRAARHALSGLQRVGCVSGGCKIELTLKE